MIETAERLIATKDVYTFVFLFILFAFFLARSLYGKHLVFANYFLFTNAHLLKDGREIKWGLHVILLLISALTFGLLLFLIVLNYDFLSLEITELVLYLYITFVVLLYLIFSSVIGLLLGRLLDVKELMKVYVIFKVSYLRTIVLFILPLLLLVVYSPVIQISLLKITVACTLILLVLRLALIFRSNKNLILNELFYFILYICTLEIAPLIIILRLTI
ncbi:MAG: hypothetical protein COB98_06600 [Flavobacteriaceae bacterium]|nr:MAG: hypothetical protein COB98_06600 [Flavobacteriaceae bacterium]